LAGTEKGHAAISLTVLGGALLIKGIVELVS
jgi:hypothetical protein